MIVDAENLTPSQAGRELGVTSQRIRQLVAAGQLEATFTPLGRLISLASVRRLEAERRETSTAAR